MFSGSFFREKLPVVVLKNSTHFPAAILVLIIGGCPTLLAEPPRTVSSDNQTTSLVRTVTPERLLSLDIAQTGPGSRLSWIPRTNSILVPVRESQSEGIWTEEIDVTTGQRKRLVKSASVRPSPDGTKIAYISAQSGSNQIWVMSREGTDTKQVSAASGGLSGTLFDWSPDSRQIAYTCQPGAMEPSNDMVSAAKEASTVVVYNHGKASHRKTALSEIWSVSVQTGAHKKIAECQAEPILSLSWSPDGLNILCSYFFPDGDSQYDGRFLGVVAASVATGATHLLMDHTTADTEVGVPSPSGKNVAFASSDYHGGYWHNWQIAIAPVQGGSIRRLSTPFKTMPLGWSSDGTHVFIWRRNGIYDQILSMDTNGKLDKTVIQSNGLFVTGIMPDASNDGRLAWVEIDWQGRILLRTASESGQIRTVVNFTPEIDSFSLGEPQAIHWTSHDGLENSGLLIKPVGYSPNRKYPLLVDIHGGPASGISIGLLGYGPLEWQMWAEKGYMVFVPEYRGSGNYGFDQILKERQSRKCFDGDFNDIMSGVDYLIARGLVDSGKMAVVGHSYGSVETNWIITHTHRFQAAVSYEGYANLYDDFGSTGDQNHILEWLFHGTPSTAPEAYLYNSAMYRASYVTTPTLFINAEHGINSPSMPSMYVALKEHRIDTQYLLYRDEGHIMSKPVNRRDLLYWCINWIDMHLGYSPTPDPSGVFDVSALMPISDRMTKR